MWKLTLILLPLLCYISHGFDHSKTFLLQDSVDAVRSVGVYKESFLYSYSTDIVQKNIETGRIERTLRAHPNSIQSLLVLNNPIMISGCYGNFVILWDLETGSVLKRFYLGSAEILLSGLIVLNDVAFTSGLDGNVRRIDVTSNRVTVLARFPNQVTCITAYGDFMFACVRTTPLLRKFLISSGASLGSFSGHLSPCLTLATVRNYLFSASGDGMFIQWDADTGLYLKDFGDLDVPVDKLHSYRGFLYSSDRNDIVTKWDIETGKGVMKYIIPDAFFIQCFDFKDDVMLFGNSNGFVAAFNDSSGEQLATYSGTAKRLNALVFWKNYIVSAGSGSFLTMWDSASNGFEPLRRINVDGYHLYCMVVYEDYVYFGGSSSIAYKWDLIDFKPMLLYNGHLRSIASLLVNNDFLITGGTDTLIFQFNVSSAEIIHVFGGHTLTVNSVRLVDNLLLSASDDKYIITWDLNTRDDVRNFRLTGNVNDILIFGNNLYVAAAYGMDLYSVSTYEVLAAFRESFECLTLATDNVRLFGGFKDSRIRVRDMNSLNILEVYQGHSDVVTSLSFSDGFTLFSAGYDGTIKKWNMISRRVAFSYENRNGSITTIGAIAGQLLVGYRNGVIATFDITTANYDKLISVHTRAVSSMIPADDGFITSGLDGLIVWHNQTDSSNAWTIMSQQADSVSGLAASNSLLAFITRDIEIHFLSKNNSEHLPENIVSAIPVQCLAITDFLLLAGSKSGGVYAWNLEDGKLEFEVKEHTGVVNDIVVNGEAILSASDDGSIIQWSLKTLNPVFIMKRQSLTSIGHSGPVISLSTCNGILFSGGSDMSIRRWSLDNGRHQDVYFGPTKAVSAVLCYNNSVYSGSEDSAVYLYTPDNLITPETKGASEGSSLRNGPRKARKVTKSANELHSLQVSSFVIPIAVIFACFSLILSFGFMLQLYRRKQKEPLRESQITSYSSNFTTSDMATFVNSSMGISKHAAFEISSSDVVAVKNLATGGGGLVNIAKLMDSALAKQHGSTVIQKKVFVRDEISKESFDQEVGIMVMLSTYPHFCKIIGYTLNPIALILEYYPDGSLADWIKSQTALSPYVTKVSREIAEALLTMHSRFLAHCDIKTQNVLIRVVGGVPSSYLTDFGITQVLSETIVDAKFFSIVNLRGLSVNFAAPEAFMNFRRRINTVIDYKKYDIYSFACVLYEIMTRKTSWNLEYEKSFLVIPDIPTLQEIAVYQDTVLVTAGNDIKQIDVDTASVLRTFRGHSKQVVSFRLLYGSRMITSSWDDDIIVWELETGSILRRMNIDYPGMSINSIDLHANEVIAAGASGFIRSLDFSTGVSSSLIELNGLIFCIKAFLGFLYVGGQFQGFASKIDLITGQRVLDFSGHTNSVISLDVDNDFFTGSADNTIIRWNAYSGAQIRTYEGHSDFVHVVVFYDDTLFSGSKDRYIIRWDINTGDILQRFPLAHSSTVYDLAFGEEFMYSGGFFGDIIKWNASSAQFVSRFKVPSKRLRTMAIWRQFIISANELGVLTVWDSSVEAKPLTIIKAHDFAVFACKIYDETLITAGYDDRIKQWDMFDLKLIKVFNEPFRPFESLEIIDGSLYLGDSSGFLSVWDISTGSEVTVVNADGDVITCLYSSDYGLLSGSRNSLLNLWNTVNLVKIWSHSHFERIFDIIVIDLDVIFSSFGVFKASILDGHELTYIQTDFPVFCLVSDGFNFYSGNEDSSIHLRSGMDLTVIRSLLGHAASITRLVLDSSGVLYSCSIDATVKKWNMNTFKVAFSFENKTWSVLSLAAHQNQLFVGLEDGLIHMFDTDTAMLLTGIYGQTGPINSLFIENQTLVSCSSDGTVIERNLKTLTESVTRNNGTRPIIGGTFGLAGLYFVQENSLIKRFNSTMKQPMSFIYDSEMLINTIHASQTHLLVGSRSGSILGFDIISGIKQFELHYHSAAVNSIVAQTDDIYSASSDKLIIKWSLSLRSLIQIMSRSRLNSLGHNSAVNSLTLCNSVLFSGGSDLTVRRWNTMNGKHENVYFGHSKAITSAICHNGSVFSGSLDGAVLMYRPAFSSITLTTLAKKSTTDRVVSRLPRRVVTVKIDNREETSSSLLLIIVIAAAIFLIIVACILTYMVSQRKQHFSSPQSSSQIGGTTYTARDIQTLVNSYIGLSKHAALELQPDAFTTRRLFAAGGGGSLYFVETNDPNLMKVHGKTLVQKVILMKGSRMRDLFFQEVAIMAMLRDYPNFSVIVGYTAEPLSIVMKLYSKGSLSDWLKSNQVSKVSINKILIDVSKALEVMHNHHLAHCDVKSQNILVEIIRGLPYCFLTDFGITQVLSSEALATTAFDVINARGLSAPYASPESLQNLSSRVFLNVDYKTALGLGHIKTIFIQDNVDEAKKVLVYQNYILFPYDKDIVQVNIETGIIERTLRGHGIAIDYFEISKGNNLATVDFDGIFCVWDLESGSIIGKYELPFGAGEFLGVSFGPDALYLGQLYGSFHKLNLLSNKISAIITLPYFIESMIAYKNFLFVGINEAPFLFKIDCDTGRIVGTLRGHEASPVALAVEGNYLVSAGTDGLIILWNADTSGFLKSIGSREDSAFNVAIYNGFIYAHSYENMIVKWNIESEARANIPQIASAERKLKVSFYKDMIFIGTQKKRILGLDQDSGETIFEYVAKRKQIFAIALWKNFVLSAGSNEYVDFWDTDSSFQGSSFAVDATRNNIYSLHVYRDYLFFAGNFSAIVKWYLPDALPIMVFQGHNSTVNTVAVVNDTMFSGGAENDIFGWNLTTGNLISKLTSHSGEINVLIYGNQTLFSGSDDRTVKLWNVVSLETERTINAGDQILEMIFVEDAIYTSLFSGIVKYSLSTGEKLTEFYDGAPCLALETDGTLLYAGYTNSRILIMTLDDFDPVAYLLGHKDQVTSLAWDSRNFLYSAGLDGTVKSWNLLTRDIAYTFADSRLHVVSLAADRNLLFVGLFDGALASFNISSNLPKSQFEEHQKSVTSLLIHNENLYSAGIDGLIKRYNLKDEDGFIVYQNRSARIRQLISNGNNLIFLSGSNRISILPLNSAVEISQSVVSPFDLRTLASSDSLVFAGTNNGLIFAWNISSGKIAFELQKTTAAINSLLIERNSVFSANDDGSIYEWSIESLQIVFNYSRIPSLTLGHVGPVRSMTLCNSILFTGGNDASIRRWNITSSQLEDIYFGPESPVTLLYCNNISLFAGTVVSGVYMYDPGFVFDLLPDSASSTGSDNNFDTMSLRTPANTKIIDTFGDTTTNEINSTLLIILLIMSLMLICLCVWYFCKQRAPSKPNFDNSLSTQLSTQDANQTATDLNTFVNTSIGISKHAALEIPSEYVAVVKKIAAGGGGSVFLAKLMDPNLANKFGEVVIQKQIYINNKINEEAFYQEVGIMVMLSLFPQFCTIIGYTLDPMAIILKFYPAGSLAELIRGQSYGLRLIMKACMDVAKALSVMHSQFLAHCDMKPQNILIEIKNGNISCLITDFGITQVLSEKVIATKMFHTVNLRGLSVNYASPEAFASFRSKNYTGVKYTKYDIYSYACIIYELLVKSAPWSQ
ncbi:hypothetical protein MP638_004213 [Amoeboaphelidium occidentale]|nr:hypothetical protein MP638_004213 [Amoeboaphelidium occidentale]